MAHQDSTTASVVLTTQTSMNGLSDPIQLTRLKLEMRIITPVISIDFKCLITNWFKMNHSLLNNGNPFFDHLRHEKYTTVLPGYGTFQSVFVVSGWRQKSTPNIRGA